MPDVVDRGAESSDPSKPEFVIHVDRPLADDAVRLDDQFGMVGPGDESLPEAHAAIVGGARWDSARFDLAPRLRVLSRTGIGVDAIDLDEATSRGVMVTNTPDGPTVSTAEHAMALLFSVAKTLTEHQQRLRDAVGDYGGLSTAVELDGLTLGLLAYGRIARRVARMARAVGMTVIAHDPFVDPDRLPDEDRDVELVGLGPLLDRSDALSLHAPLTPESYRLFDAAAFASCKPGVIFINAARGGLVDHDALIHALDSGQVGAAGLDVTDPEPLDPRHTLLHRANVVVTPHIASSTVVGRQRMLTMAIDQAITALGGGRPTCLVNPEVLGSR